MSSLEIRFQLTRREFVAGARALYFHSYMGFFMVALPVVGALLALTVNQHQRDFGLALIFVPLFSYLLGPSLRWMSAKKRLGSQQHFVFREDGITSAVTAGDVSWSHFVRLIETRGLYMLKPSTEKSLWVIIPKEAFASDVDRAGFVSLYGASRVRPMAAVPSTSRSATSR